MNTEPVNVFIRLYAHRPQSHRTPRENFVTEAFAIVLSIQRKVLDGFFLLLGEEDIPSDLRVDTQVPVDGSCFDITVSNGNDFYFPIECKLEAGFGGAGDKRSGQLHRYAEEIRRSPARRKGLTL